MAAAISTTQVSQTAAPQITLPPIYPVENSVAPLSDAASGAQSAADKPAAGAVGVSASGAQLLSNGVSQAPHAVSGQLARSQSSLAEKILPLLSQALELLGSKRQAVLDSGSESPNQADIPSRGNSAQCCRTHRCAEQSPQPVACPPTPSETANQMSFKDFISDLLQDGDDSAPSEARLQYAVISYQLYQKSPTLAAQYREHFEGLRDEQVSLKQATKDALTQLSENGGLEAWEVDWVFSLSHRAAQLDGSPGGIHTRAGSSMSLDAAIAQAEAALVGIQQGDVEVKDRGPLGVGWKSVALSSEEESDDKERKQGGIR